MKKKHYFFLVPLCFLLAGVTGAQTRNIITVAGTGPSGSSGDGAAATIAKLNLPTGIAVDDSGKIYIADRNNSRIRMVNRHDTIRTIAGNGIAGYSGDGGPATNAQVYPTGIAVDHSGNVYIADADNNCVRKINTVTGIITRVAGNTTMGFMGDYGPAISAELSYPSSVAVDMAGNVFIGDQGNNRIRMVNTSGIIYTVAGGGTGGLGNGGPATAGKLSIPCGIAIDLNSNMFICDQGNNMIRKVNTSGIISTYAGTGAAGYSGDGGPAVMATFRYPVGVAVDDSNNVYVAEQNTNVVRKIDAWGTIRTVAGTGTPSYSGDSGPATAATLNNPRAVAVDTSGNVYIADLANNCIRKIFTVHLPLEISSTSSLGENIDLAPNPNKGIFRVSATMDAADNNSKLLQVLDLSGRVVYSNTVQPDHGHVNSQLDLKDVPDGIYLLYLQSEAETKISRFIIHK
jgi:trimeric autotransporter adhesin